MYQTKKIQTCLFGLMGFNNSELTAELQQTETGEYFNRVHPLITYSNIVAIAPQKIDISVWLKEVVIAAGTRVVSELFERKKLQDNAKTILEDLYLFDGGGNINDLEIKQDRFVGWEINFKNSRDLAAIIQQVGTQFTQENPDFNLYLYHSSKNEPLQTIPLNLQQRGGIEWSEISAIMDGLNKGVYYLGYYEKDLIGQAVKRRDDLTRAPCSTCNYYNISAYKKWSSYIDIRPFFISSKNLSSDLTKWNATPNYVNNTNFGLNIQLSVECDLTAFICRYRKILAKTIGLQVAVDLLNEMAFSQRENGLAQDIKNEAFVELNNKNNFQPGLITRLDKSLKALVFDVSDFNSVCLACAPENGIEWDSF